MLKRCENGFSLLRPFMEVHRGVSKENLALYVASYELSREVSGRKAEEALVYLVAVMISGIGFFLSSSCSPTNFEE